MRFSIIFVLFALTSISHAIAQSGCTPDFSYVQNTTDSVLCESQRQYNVYYLAPSFDVDLMEQEAHLSLNEIHRIMEAQTQIYIQLREEILNAIPSTMQEQLLFFKLKSAIRLSMIYSVARNRVINVRFWITKKYQDKISSELIKQLNNIVLNQEFVAVPFIERGLISMGLSISSHQISEHIHSVNKINQQRTNQILNTSNKVKVS